MKLIWNSKPQTLEVWLTSLSGDLFEIKPSTARNVIIDQHVGSLEAMWWPCDPGKNVDNLDYVKSAICSVRAKETATFSYAKRQSLAEEQRWELALIMPKLKGDQPSPCR